MSNKTAYLALGLLTLACTEKRDAPPAANTKAAVTARASGPLIYAASAHIRVVDAASAAVVDKINIQKAVRHIAAHPTANEVAAAASDGLRVVNTQSQVQRKLTDQPVRWVEYAPDGRQVWVLQHRVEVAPSGERTVHPFTLLTLDGKSYDRISEVEVGERIVYARPASESEYGIKVTEAAELFLIPPGGTWSDGSKIDMGKRGVRQGMTTYAGATYLPLEGPDGSAALKIDLSSGQHVLTAVPEAKSLRGLAVKDDTLYLNAVDALWAMDPDGQLRRVVSLEGAHVGLSIAGDLAVLARTVDAPGGSLALVDLKNGTLQGKVMLDDISPWAVAAVSSR